MNRAVFAFIILISDALLAQPKATPIQVDVQQVNDRRSNGHFSNLTIAIELPKIRSIDVAASRVLLTSATDDSGASLLDAEAGEPSLEQNARGMLDDKESQKAPLGVRVMLKNPERKATMLKEVRGEIELYMPARDPNSVAEVPKFLSFSGKPVRHKALKANGVDIALVSPKQLDAERKRFGDAKRVEAKESGWEDGEDLDALVKGYVDSLWTVDESDVLVRIKDPNHRIQDISYVNAAGETKRISTREDEGLTYFSTWGEKPQADWKLRVSMKTAKNVLRHSFTLTNVPLP
jgi:hypothetical protein